MSAFQSIFRPTKIRSSEESAVAKLVDLGIAIAAADSRPSTPRKCSRCQSYRSPQSSTAKYPNVFCSEECEQAFVRAALAGITLDDCVRMHRHLEAFLTAH
jgi:hypothetical protein